MELNTRDPDSVNVGQRLRILRKQRDISMRELARRSGLSANALSMIERGLTSPSVSTLSKLSGALEVPITSLFREAQERHDVVFCPASERSKAPFDHGRWEGLGGERFSGRMEAFVLTLESGASSGPHGILHTGQEFVFCLEGVVEYDVEERRFLLHSGDTLMFAASMGHRWRNPGKTEASVVMVLSGYEETESPGEFHLITGEKTAD
jgi:transcriptional regulator with XRE-family HTH domain